MGVLVVASWLVMYVYFYDIENKLPLGNATQVQHLSDLQGKLIKYSDNGSTLSAVNFPEVSLPLHGGRRLMHIHENRPGVLTALNKIFAEQGVNIAAQYLQTSAQMGYVVIDIEADEDVAEKALQAMKAIPGTIRARLLY